MKKVTKEYNVYKFEELDKDIQDKLIKKEKEDQQDFYCEAFLEKDMYYEAKELLKKYFSGSTLDKIYYDLSYSQGSGAMIGFTINIEDLNKKYNFLSSEELRYIKDKSIVNDIEIYHNDNYYQHEYTFDINYIDNFGYWEYEDIKEDYDITKEEFDKLEDKIMEFLDTYNKLNDPSSQFIEDIISMNIEFKNKGYELVEYEMSDQEAISFLQENEYLENGDVF